jgi:hypothetical protein
MNATTRELCARKFQLALVAGCTLLLAQNIGTLPAILSRAIPKSPFFAPDQIRDLPSLVHSLQNPTNALSAYLLASFSQETRNLLSGHRGTNANPGLSAALARDLSTAIAGGPLYVTNRFAEVRLSGRTLALLAEDPKGPKLVRLNRLLLEDAYPLAASGGCFEAMRRYPGSCLAFGLLLIAIGGLTRRGFISFFRRWSNNREPVFLDTILMGATTGFLLHFFWNGTWHNLWQLEWLILVFFMAACCIGRVKHLARRQLPPRNSDPSSNSDDPLRDLTPETDAFGRCTFLSALASAINGTDPQTCHVFGLVGAWGAGKTSLLHALANKCKADYAFHVVAIDSWAFRETGRLTEAILASIAREIYGHYLIPNLKRTFSRYLSIIAPAVKDLPLLDSLSKAMTGAEELHALKKQVVEAIRSTQDRFLVVVDDVDRLDPTEFHSLLKTVRLCASLPQVVYVLAYDRDSIYGLIAPEDPSTARDFMDKVVEDEWVIPLITADRLRKHLLSHLPPPASSRPERFSLDFEERLDQAFPALRQLLQTPRQIKRAGLALSRRSTLIERLNPFDAFIWEVLRQRQPAFYEFISRRPWLLRPEKENPRDWAYRMLIDNKLREEYHQQLDNQINELKGDAESVRQVFLMLFPRERTSPGGGESQEIRLRRICNDRFFHAYFLLEPGSNMGDAEAMDTLIAQVNHAGSDREAFNLIAHSLQSTHGKERLYGWIALMRVYLEDLKQERLRGAIDAICAHSNVVAEPLSGIAAQVAFDLAKLNIELVSRLPKEENATEVVVKLIKETRNLRVASLYAYAAEDKLRGYAHLLVELKKCSAVIDQRLETELMSLGNKVFANHPQMLGTLIFRYSDKDKVWKFLTEAAGNDPRYWASIIYNFVDEWSDPSGTHVEARISEERIPLLPARELNKACVALERSDKAGWPGYLIQATEAFTTWRSRQGPTVVERQPTA